MNQTHLRVAISETHDIVVMSSEPRRRNAPVGPVGTHRQVWIAQVLTGRTPIAPRPDRDVRILHTCAPANASTHPDRLARDLSWAERYARAFSGRPVPATRDREEEAGRGGGPAP